jgi:hypothetical protein
LGFAALAACAATLLGTAAAAAGEKGASSKGNKVVIPFPFISKFDDGRYGQMVADMVWKKLSREKGFVIPESPDDSKDVCATNGVKLGPDTPLPEVEEVVRKTFDAQIGIWGSIERAPGAEAEIYDLSVRCYDFSTPGEPKVIYEKIGVRTNSASEVPHLYLKEMLDKLYERAAAAPRGVDPEAESRWKNGKNLVVGGDFEQAARGVPKGWEPRAGQQREPLGNLVKLAPEGGNDSNHVIRFTIPRAVAEAEGVMYYSLPIPVQEGATYRFQCRWRSTGPSPKVFIKCYDEMASDYKGDKKAKDESDTSSGTQKTGKDRREVYRSQQNLYGKNNQWNTQTQDFTPKHTKYSPKFARIMLYGYLTEGIIDWDDIVIKEVLPSPAGVVKGDKRHSQASGVTMKEMEENERRGQEAREAIRRENKLEAKKKPAEPGEESEEKPEKATKSEEESQ